MYLAHYDLKYKPFKTNPSPNFLWFGEKHQEALAVLKHGIMENGGFLLLTGDAGTGKTSLLRYLIKLLDDKSLVVSVPDPDLEPMDFFNFLAGEFKMNKYFNKKVDFVIQFKQFLHAAHSKRKKVIIIIDEAHRLSHDLLEQIRLFSNIELDNRKLINIFLIGQGEIEDLLMDEKNKATRQRITAVYHINHLTEPETEAYINHRLKVAGAKENLFTPEACQEIFAISDGIPRLINSVCDCALLSGYVDGKYSIDQNYIKECQINLRIPLGIRAGPSQESVCFTENDVADQSKLSRKLILSLVILLLALTGYFVYNLWTD
jgi:general secretion pathway protein A